MIDLKLRFQRFLMASYAYYHNGTPFKIMTDEEYDLTAKDLLDNWDTFEHQHKYLITKEDLECGSLYALKKQDYPRMVVGAVNMYHNKQMGVQYNV